MSIKIDQDLMTQRRAAGIDEETLIAAQTPVSDEEIRQQPMPEGSNPEITPEILRKRVPEVSDIDAPAPEEEPLPASPSGLSDTGRIYVDDIPVDRASDARRTRPSDIEADYQWGSLVNQEIQKQRTADENLMAIQQSKNAKSSDVWSAAFSLENTVGSYMANGPRPSFTKVDGYDPLGEDKADIDGYEQFASLFLYSGSPDETAYIKQTIDRENKNRLVLQEAGAEGLIASIAAGVLDPINLATMGIPVAAGAKLPVQMAYAATAAGATELVLQGQQMTRTIEESAMNVVGSALVTGVLGTALAGLTKAQKDAIIKEVVDTSLAPRSVGAAQAGPTGTEIVTKGPLSKMGALLTKITPLGRALQSPLPAVRSTMQKLTDSRIELEGGYIPTSVESLVKTDYAKFDTAIIKVRALASEFKQNTGLTDLDFNRMLTKAMRRGDQSPDPIVTRAAGILRTEIDTLWNKAYEAKLPGTGRLEPDGEGGDVRVPNVTETAESYLTRRYDLNTIRNNPEGFKRAWMAAIKDQRIRDGKEALEESELYQVASEVYEKVINLRSGDEHWSIGPSGAAMLKQRVDVKDEFLEDFLVSDWEQLAYGYARSLSPRVRLSEVFGEFDMKSQINDIVDQYGVMISRIDKQIDAVPAANKAEKNRLVKERSKLSKQMESDIRDVEVVRDRILNQTQEVSWMNPENRGALSALRSARSWNVVSSLSNILISSIPDMARVITYSGGRKFARAFARSAFTKDIARSNLPKDHLVRMASAMERASLYRLNHLTEVEDGVVHTAWDKYAHKAADAVMTVSGAKHWNSTMKTVVGYLASDSIGTALRKGDTALLKKMGLTDDMIERATKQSAKYTTDEDGLLSLNIEQWTDREIVENIEAAVIREADSMIITPGAGDKPLFMTTEVGRTLLQFMSFSISATNKLTLPLLQERGLRPWMEVMTHIGLGAGVYAIRQKAAGKDISEDPEVLLAEAVDKTGLMGYSTQLLKAGTGMLGLSPLSEEAAFYQHNGLSRVAGPTGGLVENLLRIPNTQTSPEQRAKSIRRLMPMQNHFIMRKAYDEAETQMAEMFGAETQPNF